jgi:hypothetical protein
MVKRLKLLMVGLLIAVGVAACHKKDQIQVIGLTDDGKYNVYDLQGNLEDLNYITSKDIVFSPMDLVTRLPFINESDKDKNGYQCRFVCKDSKGRIVGLSPDQKILLKMVKGKAK